MDLLGNEEQSSNTPERVPIVIEFGTPKQVAADAYSACAIFGRERRQKIGCLGSNAHGQVNPSAFDRPVSHELHMTHQWHITHPDDGSITGLAMKNGRACLLTTGGQVFCWGSGNHHEMGANSTINHFEPNDN